jgi:hypothetical protein
LKLELHLVPHVLLEAVVVQEGTLLRALPLRPFVQLLDCVSDGPRHLLALELLDSFELIVLFQVHLEGAQSLGVCLLLDRFIVDKIIFYFKLVLSFLYHLLSEYVVFALFLAFELV